MNFPKATALAAALVATCAVPSGFAQDLIVPSGTTFIYDTDAPGRAQLRLFDIQLGAELLVRGSRPFSVIAAEVRIDGILDASGFDSDGVEDLNSTNQPALAAEAAA